MTETGIITLFIVLLLKALAKMVSIFRSLGIVTTKSPSTDKLDGTYFISTLPSVRNCTASVLLTLNHLVSISPEPPSAWLFIRLVVTERPYAVMF